MTDQKEVRIRTLSPGDGFELVLDTTDKRRSGYVTSISAGSASVMLLDRVDRVIRTQEGKEIPITSATGLQHWCLDTLVVPTGVRHEVKSSPAVKSKTQEGESDMATKAKKKEVKEKKQKVETLFFGTAKLRAEAEKLDPKKPSQRATIIKSVASGGENGVGFDKVLAAVKDSKADRESVESMTRSIRCLLSKMGATGLVSRKKIEVAAK